METKAESKAIESKRLYDALASEMDFLSKATKLKNKQMIEMSTEEILEIRRLIKELNKK